MARVTFTKGTNGQVTSVKVNLTAQEWDIQIGGSIGRKVMKRVAGVLNEAMQESILANDPAQFWATQDSLRMYGALGSLARSAAYNVWFHVYPEIDALHPAEELIHNPHA